jgi:hypothetical protein
VIDGSIRHQRQSMPLSPLKKFVLIALLALVSTVAWGKTTDASKVTLLSEYKRHDIRVTNMCVEGQAVVVTHSDVGRGGDLQMIQLLQESNGKIFPMKCSPVPQEVVLLAEYKRHDIRVTNMCIEGHVVVVTHSDVGSAGGLQMIQIQHEVNWEIVLMKCGDSGQVVRGKK